MANTKRKATAKIANPSGRLSTRAERSSPPWDSGELECEGFHVAAEPTRPSREATLAVKSAVARVLGSPDAWRVVRLSRERHEFTVTPAHGTPLVSAPAAFDQARDLLLQPGIIAAEPALIVPSGARPAPTPGITFEAVTHAQARSGARATRATSASAAAQDCEWSIAQVRAKRAWERSAPDRTQGAAIVIGHPDTGYTHHPEIWADAGPANRVRFDLGRDFVASDADPIDELDGSPLTLEFPGHGTATASVLMSDEFGPDRSRFVTGVAPRATLIPFRVSTGVIHLSFKNLTAAIYAAVDAGCHVISMSLGGPIPSDALERAIQHAVGRGVILLAAAGNFWPWVVWPAAYGDVVAVAACNARETMWKWSATGPAVEITAPGENVWIARSAKGAAAYAVEQSSGTSFAVAHVAGAAALWLAHHGRDALIARHGIENLSPVFRSALRQSVRTPTGWKDAKWGAGILDAEALLAVDVLAVAYTPAPRAKAARDHAKPACHEIEAFVAKLRVYYPDVSDAALRDVTARFLGGSAVDLAASTRSFGHELLVHLGTDAAFRRKVGQMLGAPSTRAMARSNAPAPEVIVPEWASSGLQGQLATAALA